MPKRRAEPDYSESPQRPKRTRRHQERSQYADEDNSEDEIRPARRQRSDKHFGSSQPEEAEFEEDEIQVDIRPQSSRRQAGGAVVEPEEEDTNMQDDEDGDDDTDDVEETLKFRASKDFAAAGILHFVQLDRFMSHECFKYTLGPNVNFICGQNGSGKSAIVAAVQVGLLGSVTVTERARKLEDLIKHGRDSCVITIKILNRIPDEGSTCGTSPYKHDVYGDSITVERRIYRGNRGNTFSLKTGLTGKLVKLPTGRTMRQEVQALVDHFGFMVDNPVSVLTQTKSKEFLSKSKPSKNYELYLQATLLGPLANELGKVTSVTKEVRDMLQKKMDCMPEVQANLAKKEAAHNDAQEMKNINVRIREAEAALAWTHVQEDELKYQKNETRMKEEFEPAAEKTRIAYEKSQKKIERISDQVTQDSETLREATERLDVLKSTLQQSSRSLKKIELDSNHHKRKIQEFEAEIKGLDGSVVRTRQKMDEARDSHFAGQEQKSRLVEEAKSIDSRLEKLTTDTTVVRERENQLQGEKLKVQDDASRSIDDARRLEGDMESKRREHMQAESQARNKDNIARFGNSMPSIFQRIRQRQGQFHRHPIGPIGRHVKMEDESWAAAVETAVGARTLRTFIVHDSHDSKLLESCFPSRGDRPTILIANVDRDRYRIPENGIPDVHSLGHHTILDMITVDHNAVFNFLVDQSQVERNVLNDRDDDITRLGWSRMPNLHMVWNKACDRAYTRNGSNTFRNARGHNTSHLLNKDLRPYIQALARELDVIHKDLGLAQERRKMADEKVRDMHRLLRNARTEIEHLRSKKMGLENRKAAVNDQLNQAENAFDPAPFEQEISEFEAGIEEQRTLISDARSYLEELASGKERTAAETEEAERCYLEAREQTKSYSTKLSESRNLIGQVKSKDRHLKRAVDVAELVVQKAQAELGELQSSLLGAMEQARAIGDCPGEVDPEKKPSAKCAQYVKSLKSKLEAEQERRGGRTIQEIEMDFLVAQQKDHENKLVLERIQFYVNALGKGIKRRRENLVRLTKYAKRSVRFNFRTFLSKRGHYGTISFRKEGHTDELHFVTRMATHDMKDKGGADTKNLSGGERSYTTLAFILALAEMCQNPVRVLDEVDCFQDDASRKVSYEQTVKFFRDFLPNRQVVIITPQPLPHNAVKQTTYCKVVRLDPPRDDGPRRQTNLGEYGM